jgi:uncharacterized protein
MNHFTGTLDVAGTGHVKVAPDEATVSLSVITEGKTASDAAAANARRAQAVLDAVSAQPNHGVTTSNLSVSPIIDYTASPYKIVGYRASNSVTVKTKIGYASQIFDTGIGAGATESSGISFGVQDETPFREEALQLAVKVAFSEARIVAKTAGVGLEGPQSIAIDAGGGRIIRQMATIDKSAAATPVIPEDLTISASVRLTFRTLA